MYICICHALKERDVREVLSEGDLSIAGVYKKLGCRPRCGKCLGMMAEIVAAQGADETASRS
ncbi:MAG: bacterioferritin-associated ferredoxin [Alphaproteobacteria bacterium]